MLLDSQIMLSTSTIGVVVLVWPNLMKLCGPPKNKSPSLLFFLCTQRAQTENRRVKWLAGGKWVEDIREDLLKDP
jgi:hypothetical protein